MSDFAASETKPTIRRDRAPIDVAGLWDKGLPFVLGGGTVGGLAAANGGYFAPAWGWSSLALLWVAAAGLVLRRRIALGSADLVLLGALLALLGWTALSLLWSGTATATVWEIQRLIVYVAAAAAVLLLVRKRSVSVFLGGVLLGITGASSYGLATRLFPERFGTYDQPEGYRLADPLGYWNALGIFAALGILLAVGLAARAQRPLLRALAGASVAILAPTFFFTFSRGAWIALGLGLVATLALDCRRLQLTTTLLALSPAAVGTVWLASRAGALTTGDSPIADASREGHRLALYVVLLAVLTASLILGLAYGERHVRIARGVQIAYACTLVLALALGLAATFVRYGSPPSLVQKAWDELQAQPPPSAGVLTDRLFSLSSNGRLDLGRAAIEDFGENPLIGSGAGTYERYWLEHRENRFKVRDAHSLYLEVLAELGIAGFAFLVVALSVPLVAAAKARRAPLVSAAFGAYAAYLLHAGIDWDWEMPAVTVAALFCGVAMMTDARRGGAERAAGSTAVRTASLALIAVLAAVSAVGLIGSIALSRSSNALEDSRYGSALEEARRATRWAPWSSEPWRLLGETQLALGDFRPARANLREALSKDPGNWDLWLTLTLATEGSEQLEAFQQAERLNPLSEEVRQIKESLAPEPGK